MKLRSIEQVLCVVFVFLILPLAINVSPVFSGPMRINLSDGTSLEVPYYWEDSGQIKFEIPGGVAGIPKGQVSSVQEIIAMREFDPGALVESAPTAKDPNRGKVLQDLLASQIPPMPAYEKLSSEESIQLLKLDGLMTRDATSPKERIHAPMFDQQGDFSELVRLKGNGLMMVMQNILSTPGDLGGKSFTLTLYDAEGRVLQKKPCELYELNVDAKTMRRLGIRGNLYSVIATIKPDPKINRYEITANQP